MKSIRKNTPVRSKRAIRAASPVIHEPRIIKEKLMAAFKHPFRVSRRGGQICIEWDCGPLREIVWVYLMNHLSELAAETIIDLIQRNGCEVWDGYLTIGVPSSLRRTDLFNASIDNIPRLAAAGADFEEEDACGTPLYNAVTRTDDKRAVALARAGANVDHYGPTGFYRGLINGMPEFKAFIEAKLLAAETLPASSKERRPRRL